MFLNQYSFRWTTINRRLTEAFLEYTLIILETFNAYIEGTNLA